MVAAQRPRTRGQALLLCAVACAVELASAGGGSKPARSAAGGHGGGSGEEEIIIPMGGAIDLGGLGGQGGGLSIPLPLEPGIQMPRGGGGIGFEETEEIGPDGKPHIISEHSFNPNGGHLTAAQRANQKAMQKEMKGMAKDMSHMFENGAFFGNGAQRGTSQQNQKWENDLFKNAIKTFQAENQVVPRRVGGGGAQQLSRSQWNQGVVPNRKAQRIPNGWQVTGNSDILNQAGIVIASCALVGAAAMFGFRYYKTKIQYRPVNEDGIERMPFRSL